MFYFLLLWETDMPRPNTVKLTSRRGRPQKRMKLEGPWEDRVKDFLKVPPKKKATDQKKGK